MNLDENKKKNKKNKINIESFLLTISFDGFTFKIERIFYSSFLPRTKYDTRSGGE